MRIPEDLKNKWEDLKTHGDGRKISQLNNGITEMDISRAFTTGECRDDVFEAIAEFYLEKQKMIEQYQ